MDPIDSQTHTKLSNYLAIDRFSYGFAPNKSGIDKQREFDRKIELLENEFKKVDINADGVISNEELLIFLDNKNQVI
jgi:hypothetical protein